MSPAELKILPLNGLPSSAVDEAVLLYWQAFGGKLGCVLGPEARAVKFLRSAVQPDHALVALSTSGRVVGLAGFRTPGGSFVQISGSQLLAQYGWLSGRLRLGLMSLLGSDEDNHRFLVDGLVVAEDWRSKGVGQRLIEALSDLARERGYQMMRLDVADHNLRAKALYDLIGFREVAHQRLPIVGPLFRMRGIRVMERELLPPARR